MRKILDPQPHRVSPSISDYIATLENPAGVFRTLGEGCAEGEVRVDRDLYGAPALRAGNSAAVFTYLRRGDNGGPERRFLKCYIRPNPHLRTIYGYIERTRPALLPEIRLLPDELFVMPLAGEARWVDVVEGRWTEGATLDVVLARLGIPITLIEAGRRQGLSTQPAALGGVGLTSQNIGSRQLGNLAASFADLCRELRVAEWAHGDLKPENMVVHPDGAMSLIDCDAMWVPQLAGKPAVELGTPGFRDPLRGPENFDKSIDDYAMARIAEMLSPTFSAPNLHLKNRLKTNKNSITKTMEQVKIFTVGALCALVLATGTMTGCASMNQSQKGAAYGAGGGAALGAVVGAIAGKGKGAAIGAAIGGAVGAGTGALIGRRMDKQQAELEAQMAGSGVQIEEVTDQNDLQAIKVTFPDGILFATGKSDLNNASIAELAKLAVSLGQNPDTDVTINGHTDNTGSRAVNEKLSLDRAMSVEHFLVGQGLPVARFTANGLAYDSPIADNSTAVGRAQNRRVEIFLTASQKMVQQAEAGTLK